MSKKPHPEHQPERHMERSEASSEASFEAAFQEMSTSRRQIQPPSTLQEAWKRKQFAPQAGNDPFRDATPWGMLWRVATVGTLLGGVIVAVLWLKQPLAVVGGDAQKVPHRLIGASEPDGASKSPQPQPSRSKSKARTHPLRQTPPRSHLARRLRKRIHQCVALARRDVFVTPDVQRKQVFQRYTHGRRAVLLRLSSALRQQPKVARCLATTLPQHMKSAPRARRKQRWLFVVQGKTEGTHEVAFLDILHAFRRGLPRLLRGCIKPQLSGQDSSAWSAAVTIVFFASGEALVSASSASHSQQTPIADASLRCIRTGLRKRVFRGTSLPYQKLGLYAGSEHSFSWRVVASSEHLPRLWVQPLRMQPR